MIKDLYLNKEKGYFGNIRNELLPFFEGKDRKILDIGCGEGNLLAALKGFDVAGEIVGVEINDEAASLARKKVDRVFVGNIEEMELPHKNYFDCIILADVLEHLVDPWKVLKKCNRYLKKGGYIVASIPNIRHYSISIDLLLKGEWSYQLSGILDVGHLRFFTRKEIVKYFREAGFEIEEVRYNHSFTSRRFWLLNLLTLNIFRDFFVVQYLIKARLSDD